MVAWQRRTSAGGQDDRRGAVFCGTPLASPRFVDWPIQPLEIQRRFAPRFCPRRDCVQHTLRAPERLRYQRAGAYLRSDGRRVPRYLCLACKRRFSKQSFAVSYYLKRPELTAPIFAGLQAGSGHRQLGRSLDCAHSTVTRQSARLGRHALLLLASALEELDAVEENLVVDHFESFVRTQDYPVGVATVVGRESLFIYGLDPAPHARTGKRSPIQEARRRARVPQPSPGGYMGSMTRVLDALLHFFPENRSIHLTTDGMTAYLEALGQKRFRGRFDHRAFPNVKRGPKGSPRSSEAIRRDAAMCPVDCLHRLLRHSECHHRRETIAFGRRTNAILERLFLAALWRNFVKRRFEARPERVTSAMRVGLTTEPWTWRRALARRMFPGRVLLPWSWLHAYRRAWITPGGPNVRHERALAY